jgi:MoaA/NifB/PqqE/SkfB family radical SAM enzyme
MPDVIDKVTFEITNRCNLRCRICNIWQERPFEELSYDAIVKLTDNLLPIKSVSLTGGEALLHPKVDQIYRHLFLLFLQKKLDNIDIATNASSPRLAQFLKQNSRMLAPLSLSISIDGIGPTHDKQRGCPGAFSRTLKNLQLIRAHGVRTCLKFVASSLNYRELPQVAQFARTMSFDFAFKIAESLPSYYHRKTSARAVPVLNKKQRQELSAILKKLKIPEGPRYAMARFSLDCHQEYLKSGDLDFIERCSTPAQSLFITCHGDVFNCLYQPRIGKLSSWPCGLNGLVAKKNISRGADGTCPKCLAYHGYLKHSNI